MANISIRNSAEYQEYLDKADEIFSKYKGSYLAVDESPAVLEGVWEYSRAVLIHFKNNTDFDAWYNSDDYQDLLKIRLSAAKCNSILIQGK